MRYTREQLMDMPINLLRGIDIQSVEEEKQVQDVLNTRLVDMPIAQDMNFASSITDNIKTVEDEKKYQAIIDAKRVELKSRIPSGDGITLEENEEVPPVDPVPPLETPAPSDAPLPDPTQTPPPVEDPKEEVAGQIKFCDFCDSKGRFHKKECTRPRD